MTTAAISPSATVTLDGSGNGQCSLTPPSGTRWDLALAVVSTSTAVKIPTAFLYLGNSNGPTTLIDSTYDGSQATSALVGGAPLFAGQYLWAKFTGGDAGATATLQAYGQQSGKNDPGGGLPFAGPGFPDVVVGGTALVRSAIKSPNFVHNVSGWSINQDGTAEFQSIIIPSGSGGARIFVQASAPSGPNTGDLWVQTSSGNEVAQWNGSAWVSFQWGTGSIQANAITAALIAANTITAAQIASGTITATQIAAATITGSLIAAGTITASNIAANTITASQIAAATITATQIASHTITAAQIAAGTITATEIAAATITAAKLAAGIIVAGIVDGTTITGATIIADGTSGELLVYSGAPATGNLIASVSGAAGTDSHSNAFVKGIGSIGASGSYVTIVDNTISIGASSSDTHPAGIPSGGAGDLVLSSGKSSSLDTAMGVLLQSALLSINASQAQMCLGTGTPVPVSVQMLEVHGNIAIGGSTAATQAIYGADSKGYPQITDAAGFTANVSTGQAAAVNVNTVTQAAFTNLTVAQITANDAEVGAVYRLTVYGYGTWASSGPQELDLACRFGAVPGAATDTVGTRAKIAAAALATSAGFQWKAEVIATCVTTGLTGTWQLALSGSISETTNPLNPGTNTTNSIAFNGGTGNTAVTQDTTAAINFGLSAQWATTTGAPTISKTVGFFERVA